jgi:hypothetical protein
LWKQRSLKEMLAHYWEWGTRNSVFVEISVLEVERGKVTAAWDK